MSPATEADAEDEDVTRAQHQDRDDPYLVAILAAAQLDLPSVESALIQEMRSSFVTTRLKVNDRRRGLVWVPIVVVTLTALALLSLAWIETNYADLGLLAAVAALVLAIALSSAFVVVVGILESLHQRGTWTWLVAGGATSIAYLAWSLTDDESRNFANVMFGLTSVAVAG